MKRGSLTLSRLVGVGFGIILVLLAVVAGLTLTGVSRIVRNADQVIVGNKLEAFLTAKEVDHLNWMNRVNALLANEGSTTLNVETDDRRCNFGTWLYGTARQEVEKQIPSIAPLLKEIEEPHRHLHESAAEIASVFKGQHTGLRQALAEQISGVDRYVGDIARSLASETGGLYAYQGQLRAAVQQAYSILDACGRDESLGDESARQARAMDIIKKLRYGKDGKDYFWINDLHPRMVMHPYKPEMDGQDLSDYKDPNGKKLFVDFAAVCRKDGAGFVTYHWPLYGSDTPVPKLSYVALYKPWNWVIGSGVYLDHTNQALLTRADDFAQGRPFKIGVEHDPSKCSLGKYLVSPQTVKWAGEFPELKTALDAVRLPHERIHQLLFAIEKKVSEVDLEGAMGIYHNDLLPVSEELKQYLEQGIAAETRLKDSVDQANRIYTSKTKPHLEESIALLSRIREDLKKNMATDQSVLDEAMATKRDVGLLAAMAILFGIGFAFFIAHRVSSVLRRISLRMEEAAGQVSSASSQVASASHALAEGASQQAAALEETSSSLEEMASMTRQNAANASQANALMAETNQVVDEADKAMAQLIQSMDATTRASEETQKIIKTIDEIAFQTNLLALNAAVEAARAGEAGAGFAVVADEVRNLAMRAAEAAGDTSNLIENTVGRVKDGSRIVRKTSEAFSRVAAGVHKTKELVAEISAASDEQAQGIEQINRAVSEMDKVTQQNSAGAEESAAASAELSTQAREMEGIVKDLLELVGGRNNGKKTASRGETRNGGMGSERKLQGR